LFYVCLLMVVNKKSTSCEVLFYWLLKSN